MIRLRCRPAWRQVRPGLEGRYELYYNLDSDRHFEIAPGFHTSTTHANGFSIPSNLFSLDWMFNPWRAVEFTGAFFNGQNVANLGTGAVNPRIYHVVYKRVACSLSTAWAFGDRLPFTCSHAWTFTSLQAGRIMV